MAAISETSPYRGCCDSQVGRPHREGCQNGWKDQPGVKNLPSGVPAYKLQAEPVDMVNHPPHYKDRVPGVECIEVTEHFDFCRGNAIKYIWRAGTKGDELEDLKKARWYLDRAIKRLEG